MDKFEEIAIEVIKFSSEDVIAASDDVVTPEIPAQEPSGDIVTPEIPI